MVNFTGKLADAVKAFSAISPSAFVDYAKLRKIIEGFEENEKGWRSEFLAAYELEVKKLRSFLKERNANIPAEELERFVALNKSGLDKIAKKYDKIVAFLQISAKKEGKLFESGLEHLRHSNALLFISELEPLVASALYRKTRWMQWLKVLLCSGAIAATAMIVAAAHSKRSEMSQTSNVVSVDLPWHAYGILAAGWPFAMFSWFAGHSGLAPGSPALVVVILAVCAGTAFFLANSEAPEFPSETIGWSWWLFLTVASCGNMMAIYRVFPRQVDPEKTRERVKVLNDAFPADFVQRMVVDTKQAAESESTLWYRKQLLWCACMYAFGCSVRSIWPRIDVERVCFFDSFLSVTLVGRSLACVAELCFAHQLGLVLKKVSTDLRSPDIQRLCGASKRFCSVVYGIGSIAFPLIAVAQTCCWMGVTTTRQLWHAFEESLWALLAFLFLPCCAFIWRQCALIGQRSPERTPRGLQATHVFSRVFTMCAPIFIAFMVMVDIPMYIKRWRADEAEGRVYLSVAAGLVDAAKCKIISRNVSMWKEDIPWMSAYFTMAVWSSVWLAWKFPRLEMPEKAKTA